MMYRVSHVTTYHYAQSVSVSHHRLHLLPRLTGNQTAHRSALFVDPMASVCKTGNDYFGNRVAFLTLQAAHTTLSIHAKSVVEVMPPATPHAEATPPWERVRDGLMQDVSAAGIDALQYRFESPFTVADSDLAGFAFESFTPGRPILDAALHLTGRIYETFQYDSTATTVSTPVDRVFEGRRGVCQDFAHLQIACLRAIGLAARYVSGYLLTYPPPGQEKLVGSDASHAWLSLWIPGHGWIDLDPTNNLLPSVEHVTIGWGRDYGDVSPINGVVIGGGAHDVTVSVDVRQVESVSAGHEPESGSAVIEFPHRASRGDDGPRH
ncbi:MAG: transglutaminase N-terminal domain-containing protein [Alphaproteobacteria bacterium]